MHVLLTTLKGRPVLFDSQGGGRQKRWQGEACPECPWQRLGLDGASPGRSPSGPVLQQRSLHGPRMQAGLCPACTKERSVGGCAPLQRSGHCCWHEAPNACDGGAALALEAGGDLLAPSMASRWSRPGVWAWPLPALPPGLRAERTAAPAGWERLLAAGVAQAAGLRAEAGRCRSQPEPASGPRHTLLCFSSAVAPPLPAPPAWTGACLFGFPPLVKVVLGTVLLSRHKMPSGHS